MATSLVPVEILFEVKDILGRKIRTTKSYWQKIKLVKHTELTIDIGQVKQTLTNPNEVRASVTDPTILLFSKSFPEHGILVTAIKVLNGEGFVVTCYQTKEFKRKGEKLWPKSDKYQ